MGKIIITLFFIIFIIPNLAISLTLSDLDNKDGIYYLKSSSEPFTGKVYGKSKGKFKNGKMDGEWLYFNKKGTLKFKENYKNGIKNVLFEKFYNITGELFTRDYYDNGVWNGPSVVYHRNGKLGAKGNVSNEIQVGMWEFYYDNGVVSGKGYYDLGKMDGIWIQFYYDGQILSLTNYKNGKKHGKFENFQKNGKLSFRGEYNLV